MKQKQNKCIMLQLFTKLSLKLKLLSAIFGHLYLHCKEFLFQILQIILYKLLILRMQVNLYPCFILSLFLVLLCLIDSTWSTIVPYVTITGPAGYAFSTTQVYSDNIVHIVQKKSTGVVVSYYTPTNMVPINGTIWGTTGNTSARVRSSDVNSGTGANGASLLYFFSKIVQISRNLTTTVQTLYSTILTTITVEDACFGSTVNQIFILILESNIISLANGKYYAVLFYNGTTFINKTYITAINTKSNAIDQFQYNNGHLIFMFSSTLEVYPVINFTLGPRLVTIPYSSTPATETDFQPHGQTLIFSLNNRLYMYNITANTFLLQYNFTTKLHSITLSSCYIFARTSNTIQQFDYHISQIIFSYNYRQNNDYRVGAFGANSIAGYVDKDGQNPASYALFNFTHDYGCTGCTCYSSYLLNATAGTCVKNLTISYASAPLNETVNLTNFPPPPAPAINNTDPALIPPPTTNNYTQIIDKIIPNSTAQAIGQVLIITSMRATPKFLLMFTLFLNDLWFYKYHHRPQLEYPKSTKVFMEKIDIMKEFQLNTNFVSKFLPFTEQRSQNGSRLYISNQQLVQRLQLTQQDPIDPYFLYSTEDLYRNGIVTTVLFFITFKIIHFLLHLFRNFHWTARRIYQFVRDQTKWWTIVVGVLEINGVMLSFGAGLQMRSLDAGDWLDRINVVYTVITLFSVIAYSCCFYLMVHHAESKGAAKTLLIYTRQTHCSPFYESIVILFRSTTKSFIHSFVLNCYSAQIISLVIIDVVFLLLSLKMKRMFRNRYVFFFLSAYLLGFTIFDFYFALEHFTGIQIQPDTDRELYGFVVCCLLAFLSVLLSLCVLFEAINDGYKSIRNICHAEKQEPQICTKTKKLTNLKMEPLKKQKDNIHHTLIRLKPYDQYHEAVLDTNNKNQKKNQNYKDKNSWNRNKIVPKYDESIYSFNFRTNKLKVMKARVKIAQKKPTILQQIENLRSNIRQKSQKVKTKTISSNNFD